MLGAAARRQPPPREGRKVARWSRATSSVRCRSEPIRWLQHPLQVRDQQYCGRREEESAREKRQDGVRRPVGLGLSVRSLLHFFVTRIRRPYYIRQADQEVPHSRPTRLVSAAAPHQPSPGALCCAQACAQRRVLVGANVKRPSLQHQHQRRRVRALHADCLCGCRFVHSLGMMHASFASHEKPPPSTKMPHPPAPTSRTKANEAEGPTGHIVCGRMGSLSSSRRMPGRTPAAKAGLCSATASTTIALD